MAGTTQTSTQIRNLYSEGISYLNLKFYNINLSLQFYLFTGKDQNGRNQYDKNGQTTTVNFEGAYALWKASKDIIDGVVNEMELDIPCAAGATLTLSRKNMGQTYDTVLTIKKNNVEIPFKFNTMTQSIRTKDNQVITQTIEVGLGAFYKTVEGYLTGINADRHLDKLTEDYVKLNGGDNQKQQQNGNGYQKYNNNFKKPNNGQYQKRYNGNQNNGWNQNQNQRVNYNDYSIKN